MIIKLTIFISGIDNLNRPRIGRMKFDSADLDAATASGQAELIVAQ
jgi:hypothetical protein